MFNQFAQTIDRLANGGPIGHLILDCLPIALVNSTDYLCPTLAGLLRWQEYIQANRN